MIWTERYSTNGKIELKGHFNEKLRKHGEWIYYYNGNMVNFYVALSTAMGNQFMNSVLYFCKK